VLNNGTLKAIEYEVGLELAMSAIEATICINLVSEDFLDRHPEVLERRVYWLAVVHFLNFVHRGAWVKGDGDAKSRIRRWTSNIANTTMNPLKAGRLLPASQT
jgi:hypothetical protein